MSPSLAGGFFTTEPPEKPLLEDFSSQIFNTNHRCQFHYLWLVCSYFLCLSGSVLKDCIFLRTCPFLPRCPFGWHIGVSSSLLLCISVVSTVTLPFAFLILLIWILSLFFLSLAKGLLILFIFSNCQLLVSSIFAIVFFVSISFISALIFMIFFLLLTLGFGCSSFSSCFRNKVRLFIRDFSCFLK